MKLSKANTVILCSLIAIIIAATTWVAWAEKLDVIPGADLQIAEDLASLSGLPVDTVLKLYDAVGNWDIVKQNIFVYKRVLELVKGDSDASKHVFTVIRKYQPEEILTVYEFLAGNDNGFDKANALMEERVKGTAMEDVLARALDDKIYKVYQPAAEEQVRQWLNQGYLPEDIINADNIARAKDIQISKVLNSKTESKTWEQISKEFGHKLKNSSDSIVSVNVEGVTGTRSLSGKDYEEVIKEANMQAEQEKALLEAKIARESGLDDDQIEAYKRDGLTVWDIQNAVRLAKKSGKSADEILKERKEGTSWEIIIEKYSG